MIHWEIYCAKCGEQTLHRLLNGHLSKGATKAICEMACDICGTFTKIKIKKTIFFGEESFTHHEIETV